jgi:hypothetical protein
MFIIIGKQRAEEENDATGGGTGGGAEEEVQRGEQKVRSSPGNLPAAPTLFSSFIFDLKVIMLQNNTFLLD